MKKYKGIIFDLDGTLLNTVYDLADSVNEVLKQLGFSGHEEEEYKLKIGKGFRNLIEVSLPEDQRNDEMIEKGLAMFVKIYDQTCRTFPESLAFTGVFAGRPYRFTTLLLLLGRALACGPMRRRDRLRGP